MSVSRETIPMMVPVAPEEVEAAWPHVVPWVQSIADRSRGRMTVASIKKACASGRWIMWAVLESGKPLAIGITELRQAETGKITCCLVGVSGQESDRWAHLIADLEAWARENGCQGMRFEGREGWERKLKPFGYAKTHVVLEKELSDVR